MKQFYNYLAGFLLLILAAACNTGIEYESDIVGRDSITWAPGNIDTSVLEVEVAEEPSITGGILDLESFQNEFDDYLEHKIDFGWRYITANYDEYPDDELLQHTEVKKNLDLSLVKAVSVEGDSYPIDFEGYAHSYQYVNGYHIYVSYIKREISEELHYYYVNAAFEVMKEGELASSGGDEGYWSYSYGEFSIDFSEYEINYVNGEGLDTMEYISDIIYFE